MVIREILDNGHILHYSDKNLMILKDDTNEIYESAEDVPEAGYTYSETTMSVTSLDFEENEKLEIIEDILNLLNNID